MIVRILSRGKSFKGLATYLTHDPKAKSDERVAWTHTLNLANDHVPSAVDEMLWTARNAEMLKQEAGIRAGGRATETPVKHLSLNWSPDDKPTREHMIATTQDFLRHMKWEEHQTVIVAHQDKEYSHVHLMLNSVHPETGLKLDDNYDFRAFRPGPYSMSGTKAVSIASSGLKSPSNGKVHHRAISGWHFTKMKKNRPRRKIPARK